MVKRRRDSHGRFLPTPKRRKSKAVIKAKPRRIQQSGSVRGPALAMAKELAKASGRKWSGRGRANLEKAGARDALTETRSKGATVHQVAKAIQDFRKTVEGRRVSKWHRLQVVVTARRKKGGKIIKSISHGVRGNIAFDDADRFLRRIWGQIYDDDIMITSVDFRALGRIRK